MISADHVVSYSAAAWFMKDPSTGLLGTYGKGGENYFMLWENGKFKVNSTPVILPFSIHDYE